MGAFLYFLPRIIIPKEDPEGEYLNYSAFVKFLEFLRRNFGFKWRKIERENEYICIREINGKELKLKIDWHENRVDFTVEYGNFIESCSMISGKTLNNRTEEYFREMIFLTPVVVRVVRKGSKKGLGFYYPYCFAEPVRDVSKFLAEISKISPGDIYPDPVYKFGRGYVILFFMDITRGIRKTTSEILPKFNKVIDIYSYILTYHFLCLRLTRRILKKLSSNLFRVYDPRSYFIHQNYQGYVGLNRISKDNLRGIEDTLRELKVYSEGLLNWDERTQKKALENLEKFMFEELLMDRKRVEDAINLHIAAVAVFLAVIAIFLQLLLQNLSLGKILAVVAVVFFLALLLLEKMKKHVNRKKLKSNLDIFLKEV